MGQVFLLLFGSSILAYIYQQNAVVVQSKKIRKRNRKSSNFLGVFCYVGLVTTLILFSGLRTRFNDTSLYIASFLLNVEGTFEAIKNINTELGSNPGFQLYQIFIKIIFGNNEAWFLTISAFIAVVSFLSFYRKYSKDFMLSIFFFIGSTLYFFTMAALKQVVAMAIGIWALPLTIEKKWMKAAIVLLLAITFHPYVFTYIVIPFLLSKVWSIKSTILITAAVVVGTYMERFVPYALEATEYIGDIYTYEELTGGEGLNIYRLIFFLATPILSLIFRDKINNSDDKIFKCCINLSLVSTVFLIIASFGGANFFGRLANYFEVFNYVALPGIIAICFSDQLKGFVKVGSMAAHSFFMYTYFSKYGTNLFIEYFGHQSITALFK
jgi:hypothetical protein